MRFLHKSKKKAARILGLSLAVIMCVLPMGVSAPVTSSGAVTDNDALPVVGNRQKLIALLDTMGVFAADDAMRARNEEAPQATPVPAAAESSVTADTGGTALGGYTDTNTQVTGVDEGDVVKTDGQYIYIASTSLQKVSIIKAEGKNMEKVSEITLPENSYFSGETYIYGDYLVMVSGWYESSGDPLPIIPYEKEQLMRAAGVMPSRSFTRYTVYDITDRANPKETRTFDVTGSSLSTRMVGKVLYFTVNQGIYNLARDASDAVLLPAMADSAAGGEIVSIALDKISYFPDSQDSSYLLVGALDVTQNDPCDLQTYLGAGRTMYMNTETLVIARQLWNEETVKTEFYRFAVDGLDITYTAKAAAPGSLSTQYAMDEYDGYFRAATTMWPEGSFVTIFDKKMKQVGQTKALAPEESLQAVRFMGDTGYLVTYRQVDPLFVLDLSDPAQPRVLGELKVPGFSSYLHPVADGLLVGLGRHTMETYVKHEDGREEVVGMTDMGMKLSLFDVSDPQNPKELDTLLLGRGSYAEAAYNPRALMVDKANGQIGFTAQVYSFDPLSGTPAVDNWEGGMVVRVTDGKRLEIAGKLKSDTENGVYYGWQRRLAAIGDTLYLAEESRLTAYDYQSFTKLNALVFDEIK